MSDKNEKKPENIFEIMDGIMFQLNKTKKLFVIMILSVLILPPIGLLVMVNAFDPPWEREKEKTERLMQDLEELLGDDFTAEEAEQLKQRIDERHQEKNQQFGGKQMGKPFFKGPQIVIFVISIIWLAIGVRQWFVLSKFSKRYETFKKKQEEIDKKLDEGTGNENNNSHS